MGSCNSLYSLLYMMSYLMTHVTYGEVWACESTFSTSWPTDPCWDCVNFLLVKLVLASSLRIKLFFLEVMRNKTKSYYGFLTMLISPLWSCMKLMILMYILIYNSSVPTETILMCMDFSSTTGLFNKVWVTEFKASNIFFSAVLNKNEKSYYFQEY